MAFSTTSFMADMYELTMVDAAIASGTAERKCVSEAFGCRLPDERRYGVVCGTGRVLEAICDLRFNPEEIEYLASCMIVSDRTVQYLADYRFAGDVYGYAEGECYFPYSPVLTVTSSFAECVVLETVVFSILSHDSAAATATSRMTIAAHGRPCLEFGARRTHETAVVHVVRAVVIAGFMTTSDLEGGRTYNLDVAGTSVHPLTLVHDSEKEVLAAQIATMGTGITLLAGIYDIAEGVNNAVAAAREAGGELGAARLDSGDLVVQASTVRKQLDDLGATSIKITVMSDLDEHFIVALGAAPVDFYGVGTRAVTDLEHPTAKMVYKLVQQEGADGKMYKVARSPKNKTSVGGLKVAGRVCDQCGSAVQELVVSAGSWQEGLDYPERAGARPLQIKLVDVDTIDKSRIGKAAIAATAARHEESRAEFPYNGWRLSSGEPVVSTKILDIFEGDDWHLRFIE